jgi:nitrile hydratase subunit beta
MDLPSDIPTDLDLPRAHHDLGGVSRYACQPVDTGPHELTEFDKHVDAIRQLLSAHGLMTVDELRRGIEALPEAEYHSLTYYERWLRSIVATLVRKEIITLDELRAVMG